MTEPARAAFEYGLLLPHFGSFATRENLYGMATQIEDYGFDSVWVRDHLVYTPHEHEDPNATNLDPLMVLSGFAALTDRLRLGTASLIPHRHPIFLASALAGLDHLAGGGQRIIAGMGLGHYDHEFAAVGRGGWDRKELFREQVDILKRLWTEDVVDHRGTYFTFEGVSIRPRPAPGDITTMYGGSSRAAVRRAVELCDGWIGSRMPRRDFADRVARLHRLSEQHEIEPPDVAFIPYVCPAATVEEGTSRLDLPSLLASLRGFGFAEPPSGGFSSYKDLDGAALAGPADEIVEGVRSYQQIGARQFIFDVRPQFEQWQESVAYLGEEVLPLLHESDGRAVGDG